MVQECVTIFPGCLVLILLLIDEKIFSKVNDAPNKFLG